MKQSTLRFKQEGGEKAMRSMWKTMLVLVMLVALAASADAAEITQEINAEDLASSTRRGGTINLHVTVNGSMYACSAATNCPIGANITSVNITFQRTAPGGGTLTYASCRNSTNVDNGTLSNWTCTLQTNEWEDTGTFTIDAEIWNASARRNTTADVTGIQTENTVPIATFGTSTPADNVEQRTSTVTIDTTTDINASSCTLFVGAKDYVVTPTGLTGAGGGESCSRQLSSLSDGSYTVYWVTTDGQNQTTGATRTLKINAKGLSGAASSVVQQQQQVQEQSNAGVVVAAVVLVTLMIGGAVFGIWKMLR